MRRQISVYKQKSCAEQTVLYSKLGEVFQNLKDQKKGRMLTPKQVAAASRRKRLIAQNAPN